MPISRHWKALGAGFTLCTILGLTAAPAPAQTTTASDAAALAARVEALEQQIARERQATEEHLRLLEEEIKALKALAAQNVAAPAAAPTPPPVPAPPPPVAAPAPIAIASGAGGKNFLNLSLDGLIAAGGSTGADIANLQPGGHDPSQRGFTVQNLEAVFDGAVDPYFKGQANVVLQIAPDGSTNVELEEAYVTTTSLPAGLQLKAGQFFTDFGRLNATHPHAWDFVDVPLVNARMLGGDGLRSTGIRGSWLVPTPFYSELFLAVQNSQGETLNSFRSVPGETLFGRPVEETSVKGLADMLFTPRYTASFDIGDTQTVLLGASGAFGPNGTGRDGRTRIYGLDGFWKWKSPRAMGGFPFVKVQAELMQRDLTAAETEIFPREHFHDWGGYAQVNWGYKLGWVAGLRVDNVGGDIGMPADPTLAERWRVSPVWTWFPTEFSKLRLQYNYDHGKLFGHEQSLWLQLEFLLGAHAAHKF